MYLSVNFQIKKKKSYFLHNKKPKKKSFVALQNLQI